LQAGLSRQDQAMPSPLPGAGPRPLKLTLAYDGTAYVGWQHQARGTSVQQLVEAALAEVEGRPVRVHGSGRTDAGVHALGQVASCEIWHTIAAADLARALNAKLPPEVRVLAVEDAWRGFHARFDAREKTYEYRLRVSRVSTPFLGRFAWQLRPPIDVAAMRAALPAIRGRHDFGAFRAAGSRAGSSVRTIREAEVEAGAWPDDGLEIDPGAQRVAVRLTADGFLRHMVRNLVGTLVEVGQGRRAPGDVLTVLQSGDRARAGATAPPQGLFLVAVRYEPGPTDRPNDRSR
jgi:tRNA pseudouridine38-40 synthase